MANTWKLNGAYLPRNPDDVQWPLTKGNAYYETMLDGSQRRIDLQNKWQGRDVKLSWKFTDERTRGAIYAALSSHSTNTLLITGTQPLRTLNMYFDDLSKDQISAQVYDPRFGQGGHRRDIEISGRAEKFFRSYYNVPSGQVNIAPASETLTGWTVAAGMAKANGGPNGVADFEYTGTGVGETQNATATSPLFSVVPGTTYTPSWWIDFTQVTHGYPDIQILDSAGHAIQDNTYGVSAGSAVGRYSGPSWTCPTNYAPHSDDLSGWNNNNLTLGTGGPGGATDAEQTGTGSAGGTAIMQYAVPVTGGTTVISSFWIDQTYLTSGSGTQGIIAWGDPTGFGGFGTQTNVAWGAGPARYSSSAYTIPVNLCPEPYSSWTLGGSAAASTQNGYTGSTFQRVSFSTNADTATSPQIAIKAGNVISLSAQIVGAITAGSVTITAIDQNGTAIPGLSLSQTANSNSRKSQSGFTVPAGVTSIRLVANANGATFTGSVNVQTIMLTIAATDPGGYISTSNPTIVSYYEVVSPVITSGQKLKIAQPMVEQGSVASGYYISSQNPQIRLQLSLWSGQSGGFTAINGGKVKFAQPMLQTGTSVSSYSPDDAPATNTSTFVASSITSWFGGPLGVQQFDNLPTWNGNPWCQFFNAATSGSFTLTNMGNAPWSPTIRINGPFNSCTLNTAYYDADGTGQGVTFTWTGNALASGSYLLFDTAQNRVWTVINGVKTEVYTWTITLPGSSNLPFGYWPAIPSGNFTVNYTFTSPTTATGIDYSNNGTEQFRYF